jgi:hypothetical protein
MSTGTIPDNGDAASHPRPANPAANSQVFQADASGWTMAPAGKLSTDGSNQWFDVERSRRWANIDEMSLGFGQGIYLTSKGNWYLFSPGSDTIAPGINPITPEQALAFLKAIGSEIPAVLKSVETAQEV